MSMSSLSSSQVRAGLHDALKRVLSSKEGDDLAYHLADLHGAFVGAAQRIQELSALSSAMPEVELRRLLSGLMGELYEHMPHHLEEAHKILQPWVDRLYDQADSRGDL
jgi:hypothetical protein